MNTSIVLWTAQVCLTFFPAWFFYSFFYQAKRGAFRERSALPFSAALLTWTVAGLINAASAYVGCVPYYSISKCSVSPTSLGMLELARVILSTLNTLFLTIGATRLDNFPAHKLVDFLRSLSNRTWTLVGLLIIALEVAVFVFAGMTAQWVDTVFGLLGVVIITTGLLKTFLRYEMGRVLTVGIVIALWLLEIVLVYLSTWKGDSQEKALVLTSVIVTSKVAFMIVLIILAAAWGRYYTSGTIAELKLGRMPQRVRRLYEVIPGGSTESARQKAYGTILAYWPDSPSLLEALRTEGPSSKEVAAASRNPKMISALIDAGLLNLGLTYIGESITSDLMNASVRTQEEEISGQGRRKTKEISTGSARS